MAKRAPDQSGFSRIDAALAFGTGGVALLVYCLTLYPDIAGGDSAELVATIVSGGVLHPPGFPLYALLTSLLARPDAGVAWRFNLFSAVCDAVAVAVLFLAVARWTRNRWAGLLAATLFAFAPGVWACAICAEVFALNNLFVALLFLLAVLYEERRDVRIALGGALVIGLGLSNHQVLLFSAVPLAAWVLWLGRAELLKPRRLAALMALFLVGLLPYLTLPIAASRQVTVSWGAADTWSGFWTHVLRREYGTLQLAASSAGESSAIVPAWGLHLFQQLSLWGLPLAVYGLVASLRAAKRSGRTLAFVLLAPPLLTVGVMAALGNLPASEKLYRTILGRFWQQPDLFFCAWCGFGVAALASRVARPTLVGVGCVLIAALQLGVSWSAADHHGSTAVRDFAREILRVVPEHALVVARGDSVLNSLRYLQVADGVRPDVRVVGIDLLVPDWEPKRLRARYPEITLPGTRYTKAPGGFDLKQLFDANINRMPIVVCGGVPEGEHSPDTTYDRWPLGSCSLMRRKGDAVDVERWLSESEAALPRIDWAKESHAPESWEGTIWTEYWEARNERAARLLDLARHDPNPRHDFELATGILDRIVADNPEPPADVYKNLALAYGSLGIQTATERQRVANWWERYLDVAPKTDLDLPRIPAEIERLRR